MLAAAYDCTRVIALEPNMLPRELSKASLELNGFTNVEILPFAAGSKRGEGVIDTSLHPHWGVTRVSTEVGTAGGKVTIVPLSDVISSNVLLLKIDTEGAEASVLDGASTIWGKHSVDHVVVEVKDWNSRFKRDMLRRLSFKAGLPFIYTYKELYRVPSSALANVSLASLLLDVSDVIRDSNYETELPHEDFWLAKEELTPENFERNEDRHRHDEL
jgi:FkbM family methyltransferase